MRILPTTYDGYRFRSRQEARYAVFLDALGVPYRYELEGFDLGGTYYLPDFYLDGIGWLEVKGRAPNEDEQDKAALLAQQQAERVYVSWVDFGPGTKWSTCCYWRDGAGVFHSLDGWAWHVCLMCRRVELRSRRAVVEFGGVDEVGGEVAQGCCRFAMLTDGPRIEAAWKAARAARFGT